MEKPILKLGHSFLSVDLQGHGLSYRPHNPVSMSMFVDDVKQILGKEGIKKIVLVGHCFGGMVSLEFALKYPQLVGKMILICTYYKTPEWGQIAAILSPLTKLINFGPKKEHINWDNYKNTADLSPRRLIFADIQHVGLASYLAIFRGMQGWDRKSDINKINKPVLIIAGKKDLLFPVRLQKKFASFFSNSRLEIINSGHVAPLQSQQRTKDLIINF